MAYENTSWVSFRRMKIVSGENFSAPLSDCTENNVRINLIIMLGIILGIIGEKV